MLTEKIIPVNKKWPVLIFNTSFAEVTIQLLYYWPVPQIDGNTMPLESYIIQYNHCTLHIHHFDRIYPTPAGLQPSQRLS